jgi:nucleotide-binding universal stress UspA family protein
MTGPSLKFLVAIDGSVASLEAARRALDLAASCKARVRIIAVVEEGPGERAQTPERREAQLKDAVDYVRRLGTESGLTVEAFLRRRAGAEPYELILQEADDWTADILFMGRRSHRGLGRALLGSQAEHVLEFAQRPVVIIPGTVPPHK